MTPTVVPFARRPARSPFTRGGQAVSAEPDEVLARLQGKLTTIVASGRAGAGVLELLMDNILKRLDSAE